MYTLSSFHLIMSASNTTANADDDDDENKLRALWVDVDIRSAIIKSKPPN